MTLCIYNNDTINMFTTINIKLATHDDLTPFQVSAESQESSVVCQWRHSAGNWLNLLTHTIQMSMQIGMMV